MAAKKKKLALPPAEQARRFKEMARQLGTDERPEAFDAIIKRIARANPSKKRVPKRAR
jgi:hypothetical protein